MGQICVFQAFLRRMHGGNGLKCCLLMYSDHLQNWLDYGHGLLIFLLLAPFWLSEIGQILGFSETGQIWGFWAFTRGNGLKFCMLMYPDHLQNWLDCDHGMLIFLLLKPLWLSKTGQIGISWSTLGWNGLKFCMLMYPDHIKDWLDYGQSLCFFLCFGATLT